MRAARNLIRLRLIHKPVRQTDKHRASYDVAERGGRDIVEDAPQIERACVNLSETARLGQKAHRQKEHIRHAVLEAARHEC